MKKEKIIVRQFAGIKQIKLDAVQAMLFLAELKSIKKFMPHQQGLPYLVAPDCSITIISPQGKKAEYELYAHAILLQKKTGKRWQFYFGVLLLNWLNQ